MKKNIQQFISQSPSLIRLLHWEYWPFHVVYGPIYLYWFWLCLRARSFFFFNAANPSIRNGGFLMESKKEIYDILPAGYYPHTVLIKAGTAEENILAELKGFDFPLIAKPDIGMRGMAVQKIGSVKELLNYATASSVDFLVQSFVPWEKEAGIFYYRYPGSAKGVISGIVGKEFLSVTGDGVSSVRQLIMNNQRYLLQLPVLEKEFPDTMLQVPARDEELLLVPYGNHARGARFIDISKETDKALTETIDQLCRRIPGFYFGRLDIRYRDWDALKQGKDFAIIELNGAGSEPTHIYDPSHSVFFAWKEIIRHWNLLFRISNMNRKLKKGSYLTVRKGLAMFRENAAYLRKLAAFV